MIEVGLYEVCDLVWAYSDPISREKYLKTHKKEDSSTIQNLLRYAKDCTLVDILVDEERLFDVAKIPSLKLSSNANSRSITLPLGDLKRYVVDHNKGMLFLEEVEKLSEESYRASASRSQ